MSEKKTEISQIVEERGLTPWHLLLASIMGTLAQRGSVQGYLNQLLTRSMENFVNPYLEASDHLPTIEKQVGETRHPFEAMGVIVQFVDEVFQLAGSIETQRSDDGEGAMIKILSSSCRYCPVGVGKAELDPGSTFCPIPTMLEKASNHFLGDHTWKLRLIRERASTRVLDKREGYCYITFDRQ